MPGAGPLPGFRSQALLSLLAPFTGQCEQEIFLHV